MSEKKACALNKDDAYNILDTINMWINNCDTKVSIVLGFYATIITIALSTDFIDIQYSILSYAVENVNFWYGLYLSFYIITIIGFLVGVFLLLKVIVPRILLKPKSSQKKNNQKDFKSIMFYASICNNYSDFDCYKKKVYETHDECDILEDLLFQIHSVALICTGKFKFQKIGLITSIAFAFAFIILVIIGILFI